MSSNAIVTWPQLPGLPANINPVALPPATNAMTVYDNGAGLREQNAVTALSYDPGSRAQGWYHSCQAPPAPPFAGLGERSAAIAPSHDPGSRVQGWYHSCQAPPFTSLGERSAANAPPYNTGSRVQGQYQCCQAPPAPPFTGLGERRAANAPSYEPGSLVQGSYQCYEAPPITGLGGRSAANAPSYEPGSRVGGSYQSYEAPPAPPIAGLGYHGQVNAPPYDTGSRAQRSYQNYQPPPGSLYAPLNGNRHGPDSTTTGMTATTHQAPPRGGTMLPITAESATVPSMSSKVRGGWAAFASILFLVIFGVFAIGNKKNCWACGHLKDLPIFQNHIVDALFCLVAMSLSIAFVVLLFCLPMSSRPVRIHGVFRLLLQGLFITIAGYMGHLGQDIATMVIVYCTGLLYIPLVNLIGLHQNFGLFDIIIAVAGEGLVHLSLHSGHGLFGFFVTYFLSASFLGLHSHFELQFNRRE